MSVEIPPVKRYGDWNVESFEDYLNRWPSRAFPDFPDCLLENWLYRHWPEFSEYWLPAGCLEWKYEKKTFSNDEISKIRTFKDMMETMDYWGDDLFEDSMRQNSWLGKYMLENGTIPAPILVFQEGGEIVHPRGRGNEKMCTPFQLIEGHMRTAYLWGMRKNLHSALQSEHDVWVARI
jgi:hypothetical protein